MEIIKLYIDLNTCLIDLQTNQRLKTAQSNRCDDYYHCVQTNSCLVEQYKRLSPEISHDFATQHFDITTLSQNFNRLERVDLKISDLQHSMPEIKKYMKADSANVGLTLQQFANELDFEQIDEAEEWIDSVFYEFERRKQERKDKMEQWKSTGKLIINFIVVAVGSIFKFFWRISNNK